MENNGWISIKERFPDEYLIVLVAYFGRSYWSENARYRLGGVGEQDTREYQCCGLYTGQDWCIKNIGLGHENIWDKTNNGITGGMKVLFWQPLPLFPSVK